jgi:hypothetical protein
MRTTNLVELSVAGVFLALLAVACGGPAAPAPSPTAALKPKPNPTAIPQATLDQGALYGSKEAAMVLLHVALQEGFEDDTVVIRVNGEEVFHKPNVKTRLQIGYADSIEVNVQEGPVNVEVALPLRDLTESVVLQVSAPVYLGVSVTRDGRIMYTEPRSEPFGYL